MFGIQYRMRFFDSLCFILLEPGFFLNSMSKGTDNRLNMLRQEKATPVGVALILCDWEF